MNVLGTSSKFEKLLDKVCQSRDPDWPSIIQLSDLIRQGDVTPKHCINAIKKKMSQSAQANLALIVLESIVKNCGHKIHDEVATKVFMEFLRDFVKTTSHDAARQKTLELIQDWAIAFQSTPKYKSVPEMLTTLKAEGNKFPAVKESDAMFSADSAPDWVEASSCYRCKVSFSIINRQHHCRACGNAVCANCSGKNSTIPKFGFEKEVRVCEFCFENLNKARASSPSEKSETETLPPEYVNSSLSQQTQAPKTGKSEEELKEEEDLQLAIALSQSEAEAKEKEKKRATAEIINAAQRDRTPMTIKVEEEAEEPELARYLNRSYWEQRQGQPSDRNNGVERERYRNSPPSAPETPTHQMESSLSDSQLNDFVPFLRSQVDIFVNRMKSNSSRGRSISNDTSVQSLFLNVTKYHSRLLQHIHEQDDLRVYYERLQDKLTQVKDAMAALDALREEHQEKLRREAEEAERIKQVQMAQKLQIMRKKKQECLQQQRQFAFQQIQDQEREMQLRKEQQIQQSLMGNMAPYMMPPFQSPYPPQGPGYPAGPAGYMHPGYPPMHQPGMRIPNTSMMPGQIPQPGLPPGPQSLPPQMGPHMQHPQQAQPPPPGLGQHPGMPPSQPVIPPGIPHPPMGSLPPGMHGPSSGMPPDQQPQSLPPMHGIPTPTMHPAQYPGVMGVHQGMAPPSGVMPMQMHPSMMPPGMAQHQSAPPPSQLEQSTAELIRFD